MEELAPPHSVEAEQSVLGALLIAPESWEQVANLLRPDDFYRADHRIIFGAIRALASQGNPCDAVLASEWLERTGQIADTGGLSYQFDRRIFRCCLGRAEKRMRSVRAANPAR